MTALGRATLIAEQDPDNQTGIDFVAVNEADHAQVFVYFVLEPSGLNSPMLSADFGIECFGVQTRTERLAIAQSYQNHTDHMGRNRTVLAITFDNGSSFEEQELLLTDLTDARLDPFSSRARFSFKQSCPTVFDCACYGAPEAHDLVDFPVDYLARDFGSFNDAFSTFAKLRYSRWDMDVTADQAVMLKEVISALGDELAYIQDRYALETQFEHLRERRSFEQLTRILGYKLRPELPAKGYVILRHYDGDTQPAAIAGTDLLASDVRDDDVLVTAGTRLFGYGDADAIIPFEIGTGIDDVNTATTYLTNAHWTDIPAHIPDESCPYAKTGARSISVRGLGLVHDRITAGSRIFIETRPALQSAPLRRFTVVLDEDPVRETDALLGIETTRLHWRAEDALRFNLDLTHCFVSATLVPVMSGQTFCEQFSIGPVTPPIVTAVEREGPKSIDTTTYPTLYRHPLGMTVPDGLSWALADDATPWNPIYKAEVSLAEVTIEGVLGEDWRVVTDILTQTSTDEAATVEAGHWGPVLKYSVNGRPKTHRDYIGDPGHCLRFGTGEFGILPTRGSRFDVRYRTAWSSAANLPANRIFLTANLPESDAAELAQRQVKPCDAPDLPPEIQSCWNPFAFTNAAAAESIPLAKLTVPEFHKSHSLRAVRNADFQDMISARDDIDATLATARFTGCWISTFIATDPRDHIALPDPLREEVSAYIEEIRLVGHPAYLTDAALRPIDLRIAICRDARVPFGHIVDDIISAIAAHRPDALFHPNNFSFGSKLYRADLETRIAAQAGVTEIKAIEYRWRGELDFRPFTETHLSSAHDQIPILQHDPTRPDLGRVEVFERAIPEGVAP